MDLSKIPFRFNNFILTLFSTVLGQSITYLIFGFYYVDYEGLVSSLISGKLTPGMPFRSLHFIGHIGTSYIYSYLYQLAPDVEWISCVSLFYLFIASFIGLFLVATLLPNKLSPVIKVCLQLVIFFLVFANQHIHFLFTRVAFMICGLSLLGLVFLFNSSVNIPQRLGLFVFLNLFFTIGALTRVESATVCALLLLPFAFFYHQRIKQVILLFLYPFLLVISISLSVTYAINTSTEYYTQVEPDIEEQFTQRENLEPISYMKTHRDSVVYMAAANFFWSDPKVLSPNFLRTLILPEKFIFTDGRQWRRAYKAIAAIVLRYWYLVLTNLLLGLLLSFQYKRQKNSWSGLRWLIFEFSFWGLIIVQTYVVKVNDRSFEPLICIFLLCHILVLIQEQNFVNRGNFIAMAIVFGLFAHQVYYLKTESDHLRKDLLSYRQNLGKIEKVAGGKYLALNSSSFDYLFLSNIPFHPFDFSAFKKVYITDGYVIPFIPYYRQYLESECKCDIYAYPSFLNYLRLMNDKVVVVSDPANIDIMSNYLNEIYKYSLPVWREDSIPLQQLEKDDKPDMIFVQKVYTLTK